MTCPRDQ